MRVVSLVAFSFLALCSPLGALPDGWRLWKSGQLVEICLEEHLYRASDGSFFVHIRARNVGESVVGVDLHQPYRLVYPNQWTTGSRPERDLVDERWAPFEQLSEEQELALREAFRAQTLRRLEPQETVDFYARFNGTAGSADVDKAAGSYLIISMSGGLWATDGQFCEAVGRRQADLTETDRAWTLPVDWRGLPAGARLAPER